MKLSSNSSAVLRELVVVIRTWAKSPKIDLRLEEMCSAVEELQTTLKALSNQKLESTETMMQEFSEAKGESNVAANETKIQEFSEGKGESNIVPFIAVVQFVTVSSLLIEIVARTEKIVEVVNRVAHRATTPE